MSQYIDGKKFVWGQVKTQHTVGEDYLIVEYWEKYSGELYYHSYLKNKDTGAWLDTNHCYESFDEAILGCLEIKYLGYNDNFTQYAYRILDIGKKYLE